MDKNISSCPIHYVCPIPLLMNLLIVLIKYRMWPIATDRSTTFPLVSTQFRDGSRRSGIREGTSKEYLAGRRGVAKAVSVPPSLCSRGTQWPLWSCGAGGIYGVGGGVNPNQPPGSATGNLSDLENCKSRSPRQLLSPMVKLSRPFLIITSS